MKIWTLPLFQVISIMCKIKYFYNTDYKHSGQILKMQKYLLPKLLQIGPLY